MRRIVIIAGGVRAPVSILISVYNVEEWVGASIDSLGQTWRQKRSLPSMTALLTGLWQGRRQFESNEVRVVTQPNQGAAAALVPSAGDTANPDELKNDPEARTPPRVAGAIPRAETAPP